MNAGTRATLLAWSGAIATIAAAGALIAIVVVLLFSHDDAAAIQPVLTSDITLRASPSADAAPVVSFSPGEPITLGDRSPDGQWIEVEIVDGGVVGWVPADAVTEQPVATSTPTTESPAASASATGNTTAPTSTPDFPDLAIDAVYSRDNRLIVAIANLGDADVGGPISIVVDNGVPKRIDVDGKSLRPGDVLEKELTDEYVQRRATVTIEVFGAAGVLERDLTNNVTEVVITPDLPNDLEIRSVALNEVARNLSITVRNNSVIPLVGNVAISIRQSGLELGLIGRINSPLAVTPGGESIFRFDFGDTVPAFDDLQVILSSDAINDANEANNIFPR
jgi:hypothetical protein